MPLLFQLNITRICGKPERKDSSQKERTALAKCFAGVLLIHLDFFTTGERTIGHLADFIPFLPPSEFVPSVLFSCANSTTREDLGAVALVQNFTCKGRPSQTSDLVRACVLRCSNGLTPSIQSLTASDFILSPWHQRRECRQHNVRYPSCIVVYQRVDGICRI